MRELKLSSPLNIQIITEPERMALRIALDKSIGESFGAERYKKRNSARPV